ncbi:DUF4381 domain-containing protein [Lacimicrobium alkaliphilum]|uniref:DUF4381 domain-containing protein n=1 Tax=Lacimicrobium alkaliphilum TaxID=1526571 RepID=A0A0U2JIM6_9ALTE|nr:DUF4381 domain-containing protein [Lacimicrobium alkaliphilum]ALS97894.1 hypothetical protein AT746_06175 [Lacimicrobium alkaliphilum]
MNASPLEQLKDIHLPEPVSWWPPAPGWWILALLCLGLIVITVRWLIKRYRYRAAMRQALSELEQISEADKDWPQQLNSLLKRLTLSYFPRAQSAALHQQQWLEFLGARLPEKKRASFMQQYRPLLDTLYQDKSPNLDSAACKALVRDWIHKALPPSEKEASDV